MNKIIAGLAICVGLTSCFGLYVTTKNELKIQAQSKTEATPEQETSDYLTAEDKLLLQEIDLLANNVERAMSDNEPTWKLIQKKTNLYSAREAPQKGGAEFKATYATLKWGKNNGQIFVDVNAKKPSTKEELSEKLKFSNTTISRGIISKLTDIGEEGYYITDFPMTRSTSVSLDFRRGLKLVHMNYDDQSKSRAVNVEEARRILKVIDSVLNALDTTDID